NHQDDQQWVAEELEPLSTPYHDPFSFLAAMVRGQIDYDPKGLSSLENNLVVMKILEAAKQSAATGKQVSLDNR
ncbi:MAG: gfo/Idh/MocA family oxidoreductase, partial [Bacteroidota bacterium]